MGRIKFLHLSDTHVSTSYENSRLGDLSARYGKSPAENLTCALDYLNGKYSDLDFVLITGDLVHGATLENYECFKKIVESKLSVPILLAFGNHDRSEAFWKAFYNKDSGDKYYYKKNINGLRIITLDSCDRESANGFIDEEQLAWLKNELKEESELGSIIALHHPPSIGMGPVSLNIGMKSGLLNNSHELYDCIKGSDVRAVFSGHIHKSASWTFNDITCFSADSVFFGLKLNDNQLDMTKRRGYNYCYIDEYEVYVESNIWPDDRE